MKKWRSRTLKIMLGTAIAFTLVMIGYAIYDGFVYLEHGADATFSDIWMELLYRHPYLAAAASGMCWCLGIVTGHLLWPQVRVKQVHHYHDCDLVER